MFKALSRTGFEPDCSGYFYLDFSLPDRNFGDPVRPSRLSKTDCIRGGGTRSLFFN